MLKRCPWPVILQIVPELSAGGAERTVIEMAEAITLGGGRALVVSEGGRMEDELHAVGGELIRLNASTKNPAAIILNAFRLGHIIRRRGVSLVHARSRAPAWSGFLAARNNRRAFVTTYHGIYNQKGRLKAFYNSVMARGHAVICNSRYTESIVRERHPKQTEQLVVIHRGVDVERFDPAAVPDERVRSVRASWGVSPDTRVVLVPARLTRWKGQRVLIEAAAQLLSAGEAEDVKFVLAGDEQGRSPYRNELEEMIASLGLKGKVIIAGHCEDMPAAFKAATFSVMASIEAEAFGRVSIEAQAMGCPVIASNIGALPETIEPNNNLLASVETAADAAHALPFGPGQEPWLFEPGNPAALRDSLRSALALDDKTLEPLRVQAIQRARTHFSKQALQFKTLAVYDRLLGTQLASTFQTATKT
jgi:glycosyltransferase involved in cell wall biosynthesis